MADGLGHVGVGTPCFLHTFQRRSNRAPAIILEESTDRIETVVKGKSFMPPNSIEPKGAANHSGPQSETSRFCNGKSKALDSWPAGIPSHFFKILHPDWPRLGQSASELWPGSSELWPRPNASRATGARPPALLSPAGVLFHELYTGRPVAKQRC